VIMSSAFCAVASQISTFILFTFFIIVPERCGAQSKDDLPEIPLLDYDCALLHLRSETGF